MIEDQTRFIERTKAARDRCKGMAAEADRLGLPVLAREWDFIGKTLEAGLANQMRAFKEESSKSAPGTTVMSSPPGAQT